MRARVEKNIGLVGTVALALTVIALYSLWGVTLLETQKHASADRGQVATNQ
ncbi:MAG: hypothetical protein V4474_00950 [Patescibacteria group bacterium]